MMSGDARVALVESRRDLRADLPDETAQLVRSFAAHRRAMNAARELRQKFHAFRARKLSTHE
jgi:hypothetical protein